MKLSQAMICYNPGTAFDATPLHAGKSGTPRVHGAIDVLVHPDPAHSDAYLMSFGACDFERKDWPEWAQVLHMLLDFHAAVVVHRVDPQAAHAAFSKIEEYREITNPTDEQYEMFNRLITEASQP
jgi:hypothetical protein